MTVQFSRRAFFRSGLLSAAGTGLVVRTIAGAELPSSIRSDEYWVTVGDVRLYLYRKRKTININSSSPVLFLAHGSSVSGVPTFDLRVAGGSDYSMMDAFASWGFDVWTMDFEGYGRSSRTGGNSDLERSIYDLGCAVPFIQEKTKRKRFHFYGESAGALRVGLYAQRYAENVQRLGMASLSYTGQGSPTLAKRKESLPFLSTHDRRPRDRQMILSIFTRDRADTYDPAVPDALADQELALPNSDTVPSGSYVDMTTKLPILDPKKAEVPFLLIRGQYDGIATEEDVMTYFQQAVTPDRAFQFVPGATHAVGWGRQRHVVWHSLRNFLENVPST